MTIGDGQQSVLTYTVTTEKGRVSFWYRVSSETAKDGLVFSIDGEPATNWSGSIGWAQASFPVSAGPHVFSWTYVKDAGGAAGDDAAWGDLVERTAGGTGTDPLNADTDDDGMPDGWEVDMGFEPTSGADGDADADGDLLTNAGEYENQTDPFKQDTDGDGQNDYEEVVVTGMDPLDPLSLLKFESLSPVAGGFELKWLSAAGKVYGILTTTNLAAGYEPLQTGITAGSGGRTVFTNAPASGTRFYRVRVTAP